MASYNSTAHRVIFNNENRAIGVEFFKKGKYFRVFAHKKVIVCAGIGPVETLNKTGIPLVHHNPNVGRNLTTHSVNTASFTTNPNDEALPDNDPFALYTGGAFFLLEPKSRGSVRIQNGDPLKVVLADERFLNNPADLESLVNIYKTYIKNIAAELSKIDSKYQLVSPTLETINDDNKLRTFIKENLSPTHHKVRFGWHLMKKVVL